MRALKANPIQELRRILRDQYDFNSILKELIQNADDAGAAQFHVAWMSDWPNSLHPLLRSPAIVVLNDGEFTKANAEAICNIDVGSKGSDLRATGKFGLGMKSVFHICEAFFYLSSSNQPAAQDNFYFELLNPWMSMDLHGSWGSNLDEVGSFLFKKIRAWEHKCDRWFALVFPLRTEEQLEGKAPIVSYIPDIKNFFTKEIYRQIIFLVPLLRSLKRIAVWDWSEKKLSKKSEFGILADSKTRCSFPDIEKNIIKTISGDVRIHETSQSQEIVTNFSGVERLCDDPLFQRLKEDSRWPISATLDSKTGEYKDEPDKAEPHCAAVFSSFPSGSQESGTLYIKHALFLPLAKNLVKIKCSLDSDFQLLLHGHYFLDAGRKEIYKRNDHLKGLEEEWNESLLDINVYPLVLPAFDEFVKNSNLNSDRVLCLTKSIGKTPFYYENRSKLCSDYHWIGAVHKETENSNISWHLVESSDEFFKLPPPRNGVPDLPVRIFPALRQLCRNCNVTYNDLPYLSASEPLCWSEKPDFLSQIIESLEKDAFKDDQKLDYLVRFVEQEKPFLPDDALRLFVKRIANVLGETGLENVRTHQKKFREFIRLLGKKTCTSFSTDGLGIHGDEIFRELLKLDIGLLILPDDLAPEPLEGQVLSVEDSAKVLDRLSQLEIPRKTKSVFALQLLEKTAGTVEDKRTTLGKYALFHCRSYAGDNDYFYSWNELDGLILGKRIFAGRSQYAGPIQKALANITLFRIVEPANRKPFRILFNLSDPPSCDKIACLDILRKAPILEKAEYRESIFEKLIGCPENYEESGYIKVMRYLIHGSEKNFHDYHTFLLTKPQFGTEDVLGKVARSAFKKRGEEWRWASEKIVEQLPVRDFDELNIRHIDFDTIEKLLNEGSIDWLADLDLNYNERLSLLQKIQNESVWLRLPFHETVDGKGIAVSNSLNYYQGDEDFSIPQSMEQIVTVIRRSHDVVLNEKYLRYLSSWNAESLLSAVCEQPEPGNFCIDILNVFEKIQNRGIQRQLKDQLKEIPWIPINLGFHSPREIINLPNVDNELYRILSDPAIKGSFFCTEHIKDEVKEHPGYSVVKKRFFPSRAESLEILGLCLQSIEKYHIGDLNKLRESPKEFKQILMAFDGAHLDLIPGCDLMRVLKQEPEDSLIEQHLLPNLINKIEQQRTLNCLEFLSQKHREVNNRKKRQVLTVFNWYLESLLKDETFSKNLLNNINLFNRKGEWKSPQQLCVDSEGIDEEHLLDAGQADILNRAKISNKETPREHPNQSYPSEVSKEVNNLNEYFKQWEQFIPLPVIGGFISFFGNDPKQCELANEYLDPRSLKNFREIVDWDPLRNLQVHGVPVAGANEDIHQSMERQRIKIRFHSQKNEHYVLNLIGEWFAAKISETYQNIFIGNFEAYRLKGYRCYAITLRHINPSVHTGRELTELLYESARILISRVHIRQPNNLRALWDDLSQSDQLELEIVQHQIIENAFLYFKQLGAVNLPKLWPITQKWRKLHRQLIEIEHAGTQGQHIDDTSVKDQIKELRVKLKVMIESDLDVQIEALNAVKEKMEKSFQYSRRSIPFELFQNSDDAALELEEMATESLALPLLEEVKVICNEQRLIWMHWGRHINEFRKGNFTSESGREHGYDADLENMLFLSSSDKGSRQTKVTGKYGLGFKSVFLLTDHPKILSSHLSFEVIGGFFPKYLDRNERQRLQDELSAYAPQPNTGTIFELKNENSDSNVILDTIQPFKELVSLMLIFSRKIKKCSLQEYQSKPRIIAWHEKPLMGCKHVFFGKANLSDDAAEPSNLLVLRGSDNSALLMEVCKKGFNKLPESVPTFWVTAPTSEKLDLGFAINGPFALDIGRAQIAFDSAQNLEQAIQLGRDFGKALAEMFKTSFTNWAQFCETLELVEGEISSYSFWNSLWICLGKKLAGEKHSHSNAIGLIRTILWGEDSGMVNFIEKQKAMPSGLNGNYQCLTDPKDAQYEAQGIIDDKPDIFSKISKWESFSQQINPGKVVSHSQTGFVLKRLYPKEWKPISLTLLDIIQWQLEEKQTVTPDMAAKVGEVISRSFFEEIDKGTSEILKEGQELKKYLKDLHFMARKGECMPSEEVGFLVLNSKDEEESSRASFAPDDRVLHSGYNEPGIEFFKTCRPKMNASPELLAQWGIKAVDKKKRRGLLQYLLKGKHGPKVGKLLRNDLPEWLQNIDDSSYFTNGDFDGPEQLTLLGILGFDKKDLVNDTTPEKVRTYDPGMILKNIFQWWKNTEKQQLRKYEKLIYVDGRFPKINEVGPNNQTEKVEWIKLFLHGVLHSMGRTGESANKKFIKKCNERKWLFHLANANTQPNAWLKIFDEYIDEQVQDIKFFHWMKQLIGLFIIARRLDDYVDAFLAINIIEDPFSLNQITDTRASEIFQGGGPDAPPISRILGMGAWFIIRELVRKGVIENEHAHKHCYVPVKRVRSLIYRLNGPLLENLSKKEQSITIYEFLVDHLGAENATFHNSFDIPLQVIAMDGFLQLKFFHENIPIDELEGEEE